MASMLSGPIPQHPMFTKESPRPASNYPSRPREGAVAGLLNFEITGTSCLTKPSHTKKAPKDYVTENVKRMRQIQRKCRQKQREEESSAPVPVKALWRNHKYDNVPSKLAEFLNQQPDNPRPRSADFLRAHSRTGVPITPAAPRPQSSRTPRASSPKQNVGADNHKAAGSIKKSSSCSDLSAVGSSVNFMKVNALAASRQPIKRSPSQASLDETLSAKAERYSEYKRNVKGTIPKYLSKRKMEWQKQEEERIRNMPDPDMPPGHKVMPIQERLETLKLLEQSHKELSDKLASLSITSTTLRVRDARIQLESKLGEVEEAIKIFSRPKVFVKIDD